MAKTIDAYLPDFRIDALADGKIARRILALSVGRPGHRTPLFEQGGIAPREKLHISSKYPPPHGGAEMPFALFFHKAGRPDLAGCAFHQGDTFISSHGCVHLDKADAEWLFNWVGKEAVTLSVHGPYPASPVRAHLYKVGAPDMLPRVTLLINGLLADLGFLPKPAGPNYDAATAEAVKRFQADRHLTVDGAVGPRETAPALGVTL